MQQHRQRMFILSKKTKTHQIPTYTIQRDRVVVLGTSAPNRFRTTSSVLSFFFKHNIIRKFEVEQCSIHQNGEIMIRFGTRFAAQLFALKLEISEQTSRFFQIIKLCSSEIAISQYIVLNLCVQRRSRDGNKFNNIIRRWRGEGIIDCNADRRQFQLYLFKDGTESKNLSKNDCYIKLSIDDRILEKICLINNDYSAGIQFEVTEPPKVHIHQKPTIISIDEQNDTTNDEKNDKNDESDKKNAPICPKILINGSCTNKSCPFRHNIQSSDAENGNLGNNEQFWTKECELNDEEMSDYDDEDELKSGYGGYNNNKQQNQKQKNSQRRNDRNNDAESAWKPAAYYSFKQSLKSKNYNLHKTSDELEQENDPYVPWTFEIDNNLNEQPTLCSLLKFLGQCWLFNIEFVRQKEVPERFVNAIRQMRGINPANIETLSTDYEARYPIPNIFTINLNKQKTQDNKVENIYYHPPFEYLNSSRSAELRLKRHLHDLNHNNAHDVAFCLEACLHNFPPVFIPEDLVDNNNNCNSLNNPNVCISDPDIFFKCLYQEIKSDETKEKEHCQNNEDSFCNLMNKDKKSSLDLVWQALLYCAKNEEYKSDRSVVLDDIESSNDLNQMQKQNVLPALELFYKSLDWAGSNARKLKQKKNGNTHADHVWIKRVSVHPLRLSFSICEEESTRMFRFKQYSPPTDFCRIEFVDEHSNRSMQKDHFRVGNVGRYRAYKILQFGLNIAGVTYQFLFFGNKQVRDAKAWMKAELIKGFDANRVRADIARLSHERNIGKKMDRFHLFMSKGTPGSIYEEADIEIIDDIYAQDGKILTDGSSLILASEIKKSFPEHVASMLVRIGGAKTQMMSASKQLLEKLVLDDIRKKQVKNPNDANSSARNLSPKLILTKSCLKFMTDTQKQLEIKKCCRALPCMMNREFLNHCLFHKICEYQPETLQLVNCGTNYDFDRVAAYKLQPSNKQIILSLFSKYQRKFQNQLQKMEDICSRQMNILQDMKRRYGARSIYVRPASQEEQRAFFDTLLFLSSRLRVEEPFLQRLTNQVNNSTESGKRLNFKDVSDLNAILKRLWGGLKSKFKIQLDWPSCRMAGISDFQYILKECEVFLKIKIPNYFDWNCLSCGKVGIKYWNDHCDNNRCNAPHPIYYCHRGPVGLMKNPCLHPGSYRLFNGVYHKELDEMFDGEVLVFSASNEHCKTAQVHKLSGGDLDGDDFLCIVQSDLLPLQNDVIQCMEYDADKPKKMSGYVDIGMCVEYWLNYQINDCVGIIAELHESFSDLELAVGSPQCLELAKAHSKAVDYAKTGVAAQIPSNVGIPPISQAKYPHHMGKHQCMSYKSTSIKGILYNSVRIPSKLWRDREFRRQYNLKNNHWNHHYDSNKSKNNQNNANNINDAHMSYQKEQPMKHQLTNREKLQARLGRGCVICGIPRFKNAHEMNHHKDEPMHKRNKQMARDKAMLQRIKDAKQTNVQQNDNNNNDGMIIGQNENKISTYQQQQPQKRRIVNVKSANSYHQKQPICPVVDNKHSYRDRKKPSSNNTNNNYYYQQQQQRQQQLHENQNPNPQIQSRQLQQQQQPNVNMNHAMNINRSHQIIQTHRIKPPKPQQPKVSKQFRDVKRFQQWAVGDLAYYKARDKCIIKDILYDSYPPRALIKKLADSTTLISDFTKLNLNKRPIPITQPPQRQSSQICSLAAANSGNNNVNSMKIEHRIKNVLSMRQQRIKESKDAAISLGFDRNRVENEMKIFLDVVKVSGHSLNPSCFLNYLCEISSSKN